MSTRAQLEKQAHLALLDVDKYRLEAHAAREARDLGSSYAAFEDIITAARAGRAALEAVESINEQRRRREPAA
ncbi:hypothetical protein [Nesterenkonia sandarakina]|uniref:Uncharacterized protein n=1 Tax=Nesterenkonia sandarakina TaxID=272918 RepID=A0A7Z0J447_9MICC|nr:hypothetical protein [Nesterenkonia sandarakina]NYJ17661.1 hypothetical protein [Nesterenkonia sandarakina]